MKLIIGDDSAAVRERLVSLFSEADHVSQIIQAADARESIDAIREHRPEAAILDLRMPGGGGLDVLNQIRQSDVKPLVIILTNYPYPQYRKRCLELGADYFLDKSTEFNRILDIIAQLKERPRK